MTLPTATQPAIGRLVRALRHELGLTQTEFAQVLGVTFPTINRWENGRATPSPMALRLIQMKINELGVRGQILVDEYFGD